MIYGVEFLVCVAIHLIELCISNHFRHILGEGNVPTGCGEQ